MEFKMISHTHGGSLFTSNEPSGGWTTSEVTIGTAAPTRHLLLISVIRDHWSECQQAPSFHVQWRRGQHQFATSKPLRARWRGAIECVCFVRAFVSACGSLLIRVP